MLMKPYWVSTFFWVCDQVCDDYLHVILRGFDSDCCGSSLFRGSSVEYGFWESFRFVVMNMHRVAADLS